MTNQSGPVRHVGGSSHRKVIEGLSNANLSAYVPKISTSLTRKKSRKEEPEEKERKEELKRRMREKNPTEIKKNQVNMEADVQLD